jgi:hypothetical protein
MAEANSIERVPEPEAEEWRDIPGYEGYQASSIGRVRSNFLLGGHGRRGAWRVRKLCKMSSGYPSLSVVVGGTRSSPAVHWLVAAAFLGPRPAGFEINHIDGVKSNNRVGNLEYVTVSENKRHAIRLGLMPGPPHYFGEKHHNAKLTQIQADEIRRIHATGRHLQKTIAKKFGVSPYVVSDIVTGKTYKSIDAIEPEEAKQETFDEN